MTMRMLIDARHREETRVAVVKGNRIEEFDFESAERKQLKGNIYLAKVTRVEPSLQAAFIDYGGNRHGFLAFSEIHPDYYQIPKEDRDALLAEEAEHAAEEAALRAEQDGDDDAEDGDVEVVERGEDEGTSGAEDLDDHDDEGRPKRKSGNDDQVEALRQRRLNLRRRYKIQDVIHRRQVLLVQVVKEERGNKGAALTTYLSLAGRYCVLMPNTSHGGGISRKISNAGDRKRLKSIMADLSLPPSMGCIVRTAGLQRTRQEIKRDFDYLARLWDEIREKTLSSAAPALVYGDSDLIKRAIRDIYNKDIDEVIVEGEDGYRHAKDFMKLLMPSHARRVKQYADAIPLFQRAHVEDQLAGMYNPVVQLKSGGYLVINPTEALVSIDINSGRSTREHNIEQTATATNLEAATEIARQLRLRDMAGLVVIDFIDMDNGSNVRKVEKAMKEALKNDRARIQVGRISSFGLMEMSRQRLRTGVLEASTRECPHCEGTGLVRTASSAGLSALRLIEDEAARGRGSLLTLRASQEAAFYVLNRKRADIAEIEDRYGVSVEILADNAIEGARMSVEAAGPPPAHAPRFEMLAEEEEDDLPEEIEDEIEEEDETDVEEREPRAERDMQDSDNEGDGRGKRRRRRRGRRGRNRDEDGAAGEEPTGGDGTTAEDTAAGEHAGVGEDGEPLDDEADREDAGEPHAGDEFAGEQPATEGGARRRRGRRGRRGGRRGESLTDPQIDLPRDDDRPREDGRSRDERSADTDEPATVAPVLAAEGDAGPITTALDLVDAEASAEETPKTRRRPRARKAKDSSESEAKPAVTDDAADADADAPRKRRSRRKPEAEPAETASDLAAPAAAEKPKRARRKKAEPSEAVEAPPAPAAIDPAAETLLVGEDGTLDVEREQEPEPAGEGDTDDSPRRGWWQRTFG